MGWSGRAPAPPASEPCRGRQSQGARYVSATQHDNRRDWCLHHNVLAIALANKLAGNRLRLKLSGKARRDSALDLLFVLAVGFVAGTVSGIIGTGSSIMMVPVLVYEYGPRKQCRSWRWPL